MSQVLRHEPHTIGAMLDADGWMPVETLLNGMRTHHETLILKDIVDIVDSSEIKRFQFSESGNHIRAIQ